MHIVEWFFSFFPFSNFFPSGGQGHDLSLGLGHEVHITDTETLGGKSSSSDGTCSP